MGSDPRQTAARHWLILALALVCAGCANSSVQVGGPRPTLNAGGSSFIGVLAVMGLAVASQESWSNGVHYRANPFDVFQPGAQSFAAPPLDPERRVQEVDCTKPIADWSANLRCR